MKKTLILVMMILLLASLKAQDKTSIINYAPDANFMVLKVKNAKELKAKLENHPLKKLIYNDATKELVDEFFKSSQINDEEEEDDDDEDGSKEKPEKMDDETKRLEKLSMEKLFASLNGELIFSAYCKDFQKFDEDENGFILTIIAQMDSGLYQEFLNADLAFEEKNPRKKVIAKNQFEGIEYVSMTKEGNNLDSFTAYVNGLGVLSTDEAVFKKTLTAIVKKANYEKGLKSNDKVNSFLSKNQGKDVLFYADMSQMFEESLKKEPEGPGKISLAAMKFEKLFEINASLDLSEKADSVDFTLKGFDDGFLQFAPFINSEFTPSAFVSSEVSGYARWFFSIAELKKNILALTSKVDPSFSMNYQGILGMAKATFQIDIEAFFDSLGEDMEIFSFAGANAEDEGVFLGKLKNPAVFASNFSSIMNNPSAKQGLDMIFSVVENQEGGNQFWSLTSKNVLPDQKHLSFDLGSFDSYAFLTTPGKMAQKYIALTKKTADSKLSSLGTYNNARALFPAKVAGFSFSKTKDMIASVKSKFLAQKDTLELLPNMDVILKLLEELNPEDFKGSLSFGLWKDTNQITFSTKLINSEK